MVGKREAEGGSPGTLALLRGSSSKDHPLLSPGVSVQVPDSQEPSDRRASLVGCETVGVHSCGCGGGGAGVTAGRLGKHVGVSAPLALQQKRFEEPKRKQRQGISAQDPRGSAGKAASQLVSATRTRIRAPENRKSVSHRKAVGSCLGCFS